MRDTTGRRSWRQTFSKHGPIIVLLSLSGPIAIIWGLESLLLTIYDPSGFESVDTDFRRMGYIWLVVGLASMVALGVLLA